MVQFLIVFGRCIMVVDDGTAVVGDGTGSVGDGTGDVKNLIVGTNGNDVLTGTEGDDEIQGLAGNDTLVGLGGNDTLMGKSGIDILIGGAGNNFISGGAGFEDTVDYSQASGAVIVDLAVSFDPSLQSVVGFASVGTDVRIERAIGSPSGGTDTLHHIERVIGSSFADNITGDNNNNVLDGKGGDDVLKAEKGADILSGGAGNNFISGGSGFEDTVDYSGAPGAVTVDLAVSFDTSLQSIVGFANNGFGRADTLSRGTDTLHHIESVTGSPFADDITGDNNANILNGFGGADNIKAEAGNDIIILAEAWTSSAADAARAAGAAGNLKIDGGVGDDTLKITGFETTLDLKSNPNAELKGIEHIDLGTGGHNTVRLDLASVLNTSDTNTLFVEGGISSSVIFDDSGWVDTGIDPAGYHQFTQGGAIVNIQDQISSIAIP